MSGDPCRLLHPHAGGGQRYLSFRPRLAQSLSATGISGLTESPFSTPVVQVGDVGEHVVNPTIGQSHTWCVT